MAEAAPARKKVTINTLMAKMKKGEPITQLAAYDYRTAVIADRLGMDILCVSDTGGMILFGHKSTVSVSFDEVMMMSKAIDRGSKFGLRMVDMPYWSFHVRRNRRWRMPAVRARGQCRSDEVRRQQVSRQEYRSDRARRHSRSGPHRHHADAHAATRRLRRARQDRQARQGMVEDAKAFVDAGCFSILCEVTTSEVAEYLAQTLPVPVISLGAGNCAHGVHIISSDLFHLWEEHVPRHSRIYTDLIPIMEDVISRYMKDVVNRAYPAEKETVFMSPEECLAFAQDMKWERKVDELRSAKKKTA